MLKTKAFARFSRPKTESQNCCLTRLPVDQWYLIDRRKQNKLRQAKPSRRARPTEDDFIIP